MEIILGFALFISAIFTLISCKLKEKKLAKNNPYKSFYIERIPNYPELYWICYKNVCPYCKTYCWGLEHGVQEAVHLTKYP